MGDTMIENPATLVAILVAARKVGNRELEREMRQRLADQGLKLVFVRGHASFEQTITSSGDPANS